jgi:hypothetical protein
MASKLNLSDVPLKGRLPYLLRNNRLDWKGLPGENNPVYYKNSYLTAVKSCITLAQIDIEAFDYAMTASEGEGIVVSILHQGPIL